MIDHFISESESLSGFSENVISQTFICLSIFDIEHSFPILEWCNPSADMRIMDHLEVDHGRMQLYSEHKWQERPGDRFHECVAVMQSHLFQRYYADFDKTLLKTKSVQLK
jgi:hypothetical protein